MKLDTPRPQATGSFRPDIEGLRGVAILSVVGCHCGIAWCTGGFVGVDIFFVLSGYLITSLLASEYNSTSRIDFSGFYARRARRLLPACILVLAVTALFALLFLSPQEMILTGRAARAAGIYLSNVYFDHSASDYFAPNVEANPLLHTWSLGLEEQFYLVWPFLLFAAYRGARGTPRLIGILCAVAALSFACCVYATPHIPTLAFYELPARAWEFAAGGVLALLSASQEPVHSRWAAVLGVVGLGTILGTCLLLKGGGAFPGWIALFPVGATLALLHAGFLSPRNGISRTLGSAPMQYLGSRSYAWYLWHWPFLVGVRTFLPQITVGGRVATAIAALFAAELTFRFVEQPIRENRSLADRSAMSLRVAGVATLLAVGASTALVLHGDQRLATDFALQTVTAASADVADISLRACVSQGPALEVNTCDFGPPSAQRTVVLFGDSLAVQWVNPMRTASNLEAWRLVTVMRWGCAASDINPHRLFGTRAECKEWRSRAIEKIIAMHPSAVVMASYTGATIRGFQAEEPMSRAELQIGTKHTMEALARAGIPMVLLRDSPLPPFDVPQCIARNTPKPEAAASCGFQTAVALDAAAFAAEQAAAAGLPNIFFLDMTDQICAGNSCPATRHGLIVYRDDSHLTGRFAESLAPVLRMRLFGLLRNVQYQPIAEHTTPALANTNPAGP
jgi:peptidoglycan/LPS O-acetylase OafA/YrhL